MLSVFIHVVHYLGQKVQQHLGELFVEAEYGPAEFVVAGEHVETVVVLGLRRRWHTLQILGEHEAQIEEIVQEAVVFEVCEHAVVQGLL